MSALKEQTREPGQAGDAPALRAQARRELSDWQAQLVALAITIGVTLLFVLAFSLLTGSL